MFLSMARKDTEDFYTRHPEAVYVDELEDRLRLVTREAMSVRVLIRRKNPNLDQIEAAFNQLRDNFRKLKLHYDLVKQHLDHPQYGGILNAYGYLEDTFRSEFRDYANRLNLLDYNLGLSTQTRY